MFGIGLPEMILIMALALIVVGPDKLPDLARSVAKGIMELKKTAESLKDQLSESGSPLDDIKPELEDAAKNLKRDLLDLPDNEKSMPPTEPDSSLNKTAQNAADAYQELLRQTGIKDPESPAPEESQGSAQEKPDKSDIYNEAVAAMEKEPESPETSSSPGSSAPKA